jgi:hypothetical protein
MKKFAIFDRYTKEIVFIAEGDDINHAITRIKAFISMPENYKTTEFEVEDEQIYSWKSKSS